MTEHWRPGLSGRWLNYWLGGPSHSAALRLEQRISLGEAGAVYLEFADQREAGRDFFEGMAAWQIYF